VGALARPAQLLLPLQDAALDRLHRLELLAQRLLALVALPVELRALALVALGFPATRSSSRVILWRSATWPASSAAKRPYPGDAALASDSRSSAARVSSRSGAGRTASKVARRRRLAAVGFFSNAACAAASAAFCSGAGARAAFRASATMPSTATMSGTCGSNSAQPASSSIVAMTERITICT
jgi:hypothetical protein